MEKFLGLLFTIAFIDIRYIDFVPPITLYIEYE